jgi:phosphate transport system substrate-binding protein
MSSSQSVKNPLSGLRHFGNYFDLNLVLTSLVALIAFMVTISAFAQTKTIKVDGSSTVFPITEAVSEEFQKLKKSEVRVTVGISGTGGGFKKFCRGEIDVQDASRPILSSEMADCKKANVKYFELPVAYDAMVVVVNPKADWLNEITVDELKKIWAPESQGKITKWNQVNSKWPDQPIKLFGPGADSGTFDYFTEAIVGKAKSSRGDFTASEDDNTLVTGVANDKYALGYFGMAYAEENKSRLKVLAIIGGDKAPKKGLGILPSKETVESGTYFPLSRPIFIYVSEASAKRPEVMEFVKFYLSKATELVSAVKYIALPPKAYNTATEHLTKGKLGTMFGGHSEVGLKIEDLLKREGKM